MNWINLNSGKSCNFKAPEGLTDHQEVTFPTVEAQSPAYAATIALAIKQMNTQVSVGALTGNVTISAAVDAELTKNAEILLKLTASGGARTVTLGTGFSGADIVVPSGSTVYALLKYDGTNFVAVTSTNDNVQDGSITEAKLAAEAVTTAKIADDAVTAAKIAADAVETAGIKDKNVTLAKLEDGTAGDILYFNGTAWVKLAKGTAGQVLKMNAGATAPEWAGA